MRRHFRSVLTTIIVLAIASFAIGRFTVYRPHQKWNGNAGRFVAEGTRRMAQRLAQIAQTARPEYGYNNRELIDQLQTQLEQGHDARQLALLRQLLAQQLLISGRTEDAIDQYHQTAKVLSGVDDPAAKDANERLRHDLGICYLRLAEQENCISQHNCASCLIPIDTDSLAVHQFPRGSRLAVEEYTAILTANPGDLAARWLLNIAYMTLGEYPDRVPKPWLIEPSVFRSEVEFPRFYNVASYLGVDLLGMAGGVVTEDFDRDGRLDLMISALGLTDQLRLFHNEGDGVFAERTERAGLTGIVGGLNVCHADYNNDGHPDVLLLRGGWQKSEGRHPNSLLHNNGNGTFEDVTEAAGLLSFRPRQTAAWSDFDGDGWLDLFIGNEPAPPLVMPCQLYHNNRDGTFTECAHRLRVAAEGVVKGVTWGDYNNDGRPDLYLSRNGQPNLLFRNDGPAPGQSARGQSEEREVSGQPWWIFTEVGEDAGVSEPIWSFPCWFWDFDNDGWEDLMVFGFDQREAMRQLIAVVADYLNLPHEDLTPRLYRNRRDGTFENVTSSVGLLRVLPAMGCNFGDLDNDGWLDFYVGTGDPDLRTLIPNRMFRNNSGKRFQDVTTAGGFGNIQKGHGIAFADFDNDGDQDIFAQMGGFVPTDVAHSALFENPGFGNHWITLRLEGQRSNRSAIGARIQVEIDDLTGPRAIWRTVGTGGSFGSSSLQQEIGLGKAKAIRRIEITWPTSGIRQEFANVPMDCIVTINEAKSMFAHESPTPIALTPTHGREPPPANGHLRNKE